MERSEFSGLTVLVSGAASGIGASCARLFAARGANVVVGDADASRGSNVAEEIRSAGGIAYFYQIDVTGADDWQRIVDWLKEKYGRLDVLINNAGVSNGAKGVSQTTEGEWDRVMSVNLRGAMLGIRASASLLKESGRGAIVNVGSMAGVTGYFGSAYSASKWGLRGLTKSAAMELANWNIRVNAVHPGFVETPLAKASSSFSESMIAMTPLRRPASPDEISKAIAFLASSDASFITGADLPVDGGFTSCAAFDRVLRDSLKT